MVTGLEVTFAIPAKTKKRPEKIRLNRRYFCYQRCHSGLRSTTGPVATIGTGRLGGGLPLPQGSIAANLRKIILVTLQFFFTFSHRLLPKADIGSLSFPQQLWQLGDIHGVRGSFHAVATRPTPACAGGSSGEPAAAT